MNNVAQCEFKIVLEWANAAFALLAVIFWFASTWSGWTSFRSWNVRRSVAQALVITRSPRRSAGGFRADSRLVELGLKA
jgi:hypothetical protein